MKEFCSFLGSKRWNLALNAALLAGICAYLFCLTVPGAAGGITSNQLEGGPYYSYVVAPNGDLIGWGGKEYLLSDKGTTVHSPVFLMGDVKQAVAGHGFAAAVKTDHSLWVWHGSLKPRSIMDRVDRCFYCGGTLFALDLDGGLYYWNSLPDMLAVKKDASPLLPGPAVKEMSYAYSFCTQCLTEDGALYLLNWNEDLTDASLTGPVRQDVDSLCEGGLVTQSGELICWKWGGERDPRVSSLQTAQNVQCAENEFLYVTRDGKIHAENTIFPISLRTVSPIFRNLFLLWAAVKILSLTARKKQNA